jgi:hypothetical protein
MQNGELVIRLIRRHWFYLWPKTILLVIIAVIPVALVSWLLDVIGVVDDLGWFYTIPVAGWLIWWSIQAFLNWYRYDNDIWVVTNQRLIDSFKPHPFRHRLATADLVNVQDTSVLRAGIFATILGFGDVVCHTAGAGLQPFRIIGTPNPAEVQLLIDKERDRERNRLHGAEGP